MTIIQPDQYSWRFKNPLREAVMLRPSRHGEVALEAFLSPEIVSVFRLVLGLILFHNVSCHSQLWATSPFLKPVRAGFRDERPLY